MARLRILRTALRDASSAHAYLEGQRRGRGRRFLVLLNQLLDEIADNPYRYAVTRSPYRLGLEPKFSYLVYYTVSDDGGEVTVYAIAHSARDQDAVIGTLPP
jgi:plasmid stabilization system protein ParE